MVHGFDYSITNVSQVYRSAKNPEQGVDHRNDIAMNLPKVISAAPGNE